MLLDLSAFAIGLVGGWSLLFLRWPRGHLPAAGLFGAVWMGWLLALGVLVVWTGVDWMVVASGAALGLAGHGLLIGGLLILRRQNGGIR